MIISPAWGLACLFVGLLTAFFLRHIPHPSCFHEGRHRNLEGLRGVVALIMFICHASTWQQHLLDGTWRVSDTPQYILPSQKGIIIFFMLTAFLIARKLLISKDASEDWIQVYTSRILKLVPAYAVMLIILFTTILVQTWLNTETWHECSLESFLSWVVFTIPGAPELCKFKENNIAIAGVTWSLTYEWVFYFSLPLLAVLSGKKPSWVALLICGGLLILVFNAIPKYPVVYLSFDFGIISAFSDHLYPLQKLQDSILVSVAAVLLLIFNGFIHLQTFYTIASVFIVSFAFHVFASGKILMGIISTRTFQVLGLGTYSLYSFHGLLLFFGLTGITHFIPELPNNNLMCWSFIIFLTPMLIAGTLAMYLIVERPPLQRTQKVSAWIDKVIARTSIAVGKSLK